MIFSENRFPLFGLMLLRGNPMDEEALNTSVRKFLKKVGVTAQREIEKAVRDAAESGKLKPGGYQAVFDALGGSVFTADF